LQTQINPTLFLITLAQRKKILLLAIMAGIAGVIIGGIALYLSFTMVNP
jgi:hypothetical protein